MCLKNISSIFLNILLSMTVIWVKALCLQKACILRKMKDPGEKPTNRATARNIPQWLTDQICNVPLMPMSFHVCDVAYKTSNRREGKDQKHEANMGCGVGQLKVLGSQQEVKSGLEDQKYEAL